jgi:outer membrane beta-barrel protein
MNQQFDNLGSNEDIIEKARALQPSNSMRIVQKREVDRNWRGELGLNYGYVGGGDTYIDTRSWGAAADLHITPNWSVGLRYTDHKNEYTSEGKRVYANMLKTSGTVPDVDYQESSIMGVLNWYPIYGKVSWLQSVVSQFDFYVLAGGGQTKLSQTTSPIYTGGAGMGLWWNNYISSRIEVRYENYKDHVYTGDRNVNAFVAQFGIGFML